MSTQPTQPAGSSTTTNDEAEVVLLGTVLAGEVDGHVDELARYILESRWMRQHDAAAGARVRQQIAAEIEAKRKPEWKQDDADWGEWAFDSGLAAAARVVRGDQEGRNDN